MSYNSDLLILFGAGVYAKKYKALLEYVGIDFDYFTDNDSSKWGTVLYGKKVLAPDALLEIQNCRIIISCTHEIAIAKQLSNMGLQHKILGLDELYEFYENKREYSGNVTMFKSEQTIFMDMYEGIGWGGSEIWAANLAYHLKQNGKQIVLLGGNEQPSLEDKYENMTLRVSEHDTIKKIVDLFEKNLPAVFVNNFAGCGFMAAALVKKRYPEQMKIISVIHNDNRALYDAHMLMEQYIDEIFCVSNQIKEHMQEIYSFDHKHYFFKEQPMEIDNRWNELKETANFVRIGYAGRLVKQQKRTDLLPKLILQLEKRKIEYLLQIAGDGDCFPMLEEFIHENGLEKKVQLLGRIPKSKMDKFWKRQDIFINISEYEGTSLSMLEAMSYNCVPVVTEVSGAREFIVPGQNGYICTVGNFEMMAKCIDELFHNRELLKVYGTICRQIVINKCDIDNYVEFWNENLL